MTTPPQETMDHAFEAICMLLMPFFMIGAGDDPEKARGAVADLIRAYDPVTIQELELAARVIGFSTAALDNLRLSMTTRSDMKILRFRSTAVTLSHWAEECRVMLNKLQAERPEALVALPVPARLSHPLPPMTAARIETAKAEARDLLTGLARLGAASQPDQGMTAIHLTPDPSAG